MSNEETVFGIDLGTTYSCIAYVDGDRPVVINNFVNKPTTPSVVQFKGDEVLVGEAAKNEAVFAPDTVVEMVKRHMGQPGWTFEDKAHNRKYTAEEVSALILKKVVEDAERAVGHKIKKAVITCPAYFNINERDATANAGKIAGLEVPEILNEPTAAAIAYGIQNERDQTVLVYDLGGGTFDVTMISIKGGAITVLATGGNRELGGRDWDERVVNYLANQWKQETNSTDNPVDSPQTLQELWGRAEEAKYALTGQRETTVRVSHAGQLRGIRLTREKFDELTADLLDNTITYTRLMLDDAKRLHGVTQFDQLLLVGGSTRMPQVAERLRKEFNMEPKLLDPDEIVAKGAAIYGLKLAIGEKIKYIESQGVSTEQAEQQVASDLGLRLPMVEKLQETEITIVASHSVGVIALNAADNEIIANLVKIQSPLPRMEKQRFGTRHAGARSAEIRVYEDDIPDEEVPDMSWGRAIGTEVLSLPPGLPQGAPIEIEFEINKQGRLDMTARDLTSGNEVKATFQATAGMTPEEVDKSIVRIGKISVV